MTNAVAIAQYGSTSPNKNRIINGAMVIDQRNAGASVTLGATDTYNLDRWVASATQASKLSVQQNAGSVTPPAGFSKYLGLTSLSAYSIVSSDIFTINQAIEGLNVADLGWGAAGASTVTLSFWVRSSLTGTFGASLSNSGNSRCYPFTYTINSANTWEQKTVTIAGDTTGTWLTTNGIGIFLRFGLGVGSSYSGTAGAWTGTTNTFSATGATSVVATNGATFYITGVQLEAGTTASPFENRQYGTELQLCQRYFQKSYNVDVALGTVTNAGMANTRVANTDPFIPSITQRFPVVMRTTATITWYSNSTGTSGKVQSGGSDVTVSANYDVGASTTGQIQLASAPSAGGQINGHFTASAEL
ncbi:hypothetical protein EBT25_10320 [bacterium]|nr:hypothetical protein [bacterium]